MGKRYGRNQKRRHREEIAAQAERIEQGDRMVENLQRRLGYVDDFDQRVRRKLGECSAYRVEIAQREGRVQPLMPVYQPVSYAVMSREEMMDPIRVQTERMYRFIVKMERNEFDDRRVFKIEETNHHGGVVAISMTEDAIRDIGFERRDVFHFATQIAELLCRGVE